MGLQLLLMIKQIYERVQAYRRLNYFEKVKRDAIRRKYRLRPYRTYWDGFWGYVWFPFTLASHLIYDFFESIITSVGRKGPEVRRKGQMRRVLKSNTEENKLFRKVLSFLFGIVFTYSVFSFIYYNSLMNNNPLILWTIALLIALGLIAPFKRALLCLIIVALPSLFSSKVRYVLVAYVFYLLYIQIFTNIWDNGTEGLESFGCSVFEVGRGAKKMSGLLVADIKEFIRDTKQKIKDMLEELDKFFDKFKIHLNLPALNLKVLCNSPMDEDIYKCEDKLTLFETPMGRVYLPWLCSEMWNVVAETCQEMKELAHKMYVEARDALKKTIEQIKKELYFDVDLNYQIEYHYNTSKDFKKVFETIGEEFMERHPFLGYLVYLKNLQVVFLLIFTFWIAIMYLDIS